MTSVETIRQSTRNAMAELLDLAKVRKGQLFVVGCSTSEIVGKKIGTDLTWRFNVVNILIVHLLWTVAL